MRDDIQKSIKEYEISTFLFKSDIEEAEKLIDDDENVIIVLATNFSITYPDPTKRVACPGVVFMTNKRMILYYKPLYEGISDITHITDIKDIKLINGVNHIQVYTEDKVYDFVVTPKVFRHSNLQNAVNKIYRAFLFAKNPNGFEMSENTEPPKSTEQSTQDIPEQIEKLSALKDKGIISEEEFQSKKTELLSRM